jgi:formate dehydrogenase subunit beta
METIQTNIRETAKELLSSGRIELLIGFENGTLPMRARPAFIRQAADAERLVWNSWCANNLAVYLPGLFEPKKHKKNEAPPPLPKVGIIAKSCDVRSVINLVREHQLPRQNVVIVGVPCAGMLDAAKINVLIGEDAASVEDDGKTASVSGRSHSKSKKMERDDVVFDACLECRFPAPEGVDILIPGTARSISRDKYSRVKKFESMAASERWKHFESEISRCIRCNACRQACPNCFCKECFADQTNPRWLDAGDDVSDAMLYHIGRIFHQAGRCVECDACTRACPMGIDIRTFTQKLASDVKDLYGFVPGFSTEEPLPLCTYAPDDKQDFITEP